MGKRGIKEFGGRSPALSRREYSICSSVVFLLVCTTSLRTLEVAQLFRFSTKVWIAIGGACGVINGKVEVESNYIEWGENTWCLRNGWSDSLIALYWSFIFVYSVGLSNRFTLCTRLPWGDLPAAFPMSAAAYLALTKPTEYMCFMYNLLVPSVMQVPFFCGCRPSFLPGHPPSPVLWVQGCSWESSR